MSVYINGVDKQGAYVNGVQVLQTLSPASETVAKGIYAATTLSAVDSDLATGNIKDGATVFGFAGTVTLAEDTEEVGKNDQLCTDGFAGEYKEFIVGAFGTETLASVTPTFDASSLAFAVAFANCTAESSLVTIDLVMGGVQMQSEALSTDGVTYLLKDFKVLSGTQSCFVPLSNQDSSPHWVKFYGYDYMSEIPAGIGVGSVKIT